MNKRRATEELYPADQTKRQDGGRAVEFASNLRALNQAFARWVQQQALSCGDQLWLDGVQDYAKQADKLLEEYGDLLKDGGKRASSPALASNILNTPAGTGSGAANADTSSAGRATGGSTGRKSVTFAASPAFGTPAGAAAAPPVNAFATPGGFAPNTSNAGHTPAPAGGFAFGTPSSADGKTATVTPGTDGKSLAGTPAFGGSATVAFSSGVGSAPAASAAADSAPQPGSAPGGLLFGVSSSSSPAATTGGDNTAAAPNTSSAFGGSSSGAFGGTGGSSGFSFGTPASNATGSPGATTAAASGFSFGAINAGASSSSSPSTFSFAAMPSTAAAAGSSAAPGFGFGAASAAAGGSTPGSMFQFPAAAATAGAADVSANGGAAGDDGGADEAPATYKSEIKVDESVWNVFFTAKARLHVRVKRDGGTTDWEPRGLGVLTVRQPKEGANSERCYVMFSTEGGKQLVASQLMSNSVVMPFPNQPKKCRMSLMVLQYDLPPASAGKESGEGAGAATETRAKHQLQVCMITLGSEAKVAELTKTVEDKKPKA